MRHTRINKYEVMWLFVFFDLPVTTKIQRKRATRFRKRLLQDGFTMMQFSVYTRHCASRESTQVHIKRVEDMVPDRGQVSIVQITDKQYSDILNFWGRDTEPLPEMPAQLEIF